MGGPVDAGVHSAMKSAKTRDLMAVRATNFTGKGASSTSHLPMHPVVSRLRNMLPSGYEVGSVMSWARK